MKTFTVHEPPNPPSDRVDRGERLLFVNDGFSWAAVLFTPLWMAAHRLWLPLLAYFGLALLIDAGLAALGVASAWILLLALALQLAVGFEASSLRRWGIERKGWHTVGSVVGRSLGECERRFLDAWLPDQPAIAAPGSAAPAFHDPAGQPRSASVEASARRGWRRLLARS